MNFICDTWWRICAVLGRRFWWFDCCEKFFAKDGNEYYYVYVAVGFIGSEEADGEQKYYTYHSYIDTESKEPNEDEGFKIDTSNYEKFDKFKYVFIKDNATGNIYVDHIERVK